MAGTELNTQLVSNFQISTVTAQLAQAVSEELDGLGDITYDRIRIPTGGGLAFEVPTDDPDAPESATELVGVILYHNAINAYWREKYNGGHDRPDCASHDGKTGIDAETGEIKSCESCPLNAFGVKGGRKKCKNMHRVYLLTSSSPLPVMLTLPPTSLKNLNTYLVKQVLSKGLRSWQVLTRVKLKKEQNRDGIVYSQAVFSSVGALLPEQQSQTEKMSAITRENARCANVEADDFEQPPCSARGDASDLEFEEVESR